MRHRLSPDSVAPGADSEVMAPNPLDSISRTVARVRDLERAAVTDSLKAALPPGLSHSQTVGGKARPVGQFAWSPDGESFAISYLKDVVELWSAEGNDLIGTLPELGSPELVWSPDGHRLATRTHVWSLPTGQIVHDLAGRPFCYSPDGRQMAITRPGRGILLCSTESGQTEKLIASCHSPGGALTYSPDGDLLAASSPEGHIRIWSTGTGQLLRTLYGHSSPVTALLWPEPHRLVSASWDGTVRVWNADSGTEQRLLTGATQTITGVAVSPDGRWIAGAFFDGQVCIWRMSDGAPAGAFSAVRRDGWHAVAFHPRRPLLAVSGGNMVQLLLLDETALQPIVPPAPQQPADDGPMWISGSMGVGKSHVSIALVGAFFGGTLKMSTEIAAAPGLVDHVRRVEVARKRTRNDSGQAICEAWLVAASRALRQEIDQWAHYDAVLYVDERQRPARPRLPAWSRAVALAERKRHPEAPPLRRILMTWDGDYAESERHHFDEVVVTGPDQTLGELSRTLHRLIDWSLVRRFTSLNGLLRLASWRHKAGDGLLASREVLRRHFHSSSSPLCDAANSEFENALSLFTACGILGPLPLGNLIVLRPQVLERYAREIRALRSRSRVSGADADIRPAQLNLPVYQRARVPQVEELIMAAAANKERGKKVAQKPLSPAGDDEIWTKLWTDYAALVAAVKQANVAPGDPVAETVRWQLSGLQTDRVPSAMEDPQLPELYSGAPWLAANDLPDRLRKSWVTFVTINPAINPKEDYPSLADLSHPNLAGELAQYFRHRFDRQVVAGAHRHGRDRLGRIRVYQTDGCNTHNATWSKLDGLVRAVLRRAQIEDALVPAPLGQVSMIVDAVPWKFNNWRTLDRERKDQLRAAGLGYVRDVLLQHRPPVIVAMSSDAAASIADLFAQDGAVLEEEQRFRWDLQVWRGRAQAAPEYSPLIIRGVHPADPGFSGRGNRTRMEEILLRYTGW